MNRIDISSAFSDKLKKRVREARAGSEVKERGVFTNWLYRHKLMQRAVEEGDSDKIEWLSRYFRATLGVGQICLTPNRDWDLIEDPEASCNLLPSAGLDYALGAAFDDGTTTRITTFYIHLQEGDFPVAAGWTAANYNANANELTDYSGNAPAWTSGAVSGASISNSGSEAAFTISGTVTARGAALADTATKPLASGTLAAASRFGNDRSLFTSDILNVGYQIDYANA